MANPGLNDPSGAASAPLPLGREVTIATAAYGNAATTRICLEALLRSATGDFELILVDDCSPDAGAIQALFLEVADRHANTSIFSFQQNLEYSGSVNAILSHARGASVFFISNDVFVTPHYLRAMLAAAHANPRLGILRGSSNFVDNGLPSHNIALASPVTNIGELFALGAGLEKSHGHATLPDPFLVGDAFLVTRSVIERIGTFDPWFYGYFADPDFGLRARVAGFEPALVPGAFAYHQQDANFGYLPDAERKAKVERRWVRVIENWARFKLKWGMPVEQPYQSIAGLPWSELAARPFEAQRHFTAPRDYTRFMTRQGTGPG